MSKPKYSASKMNVTVTSPKGVSITSPKGSLIAEINNLRKELKDYKQSRKEGERSAVKDTSGSVFVGGVRSPQERGISNTLGMNKTSKQRFFRAQRDQIVHLSPTNDTHHNRSKTPKGDQHQRRDKSPQNKPQKLTTYNRQQSQSSLYSNSKSIKNRYNNINTSQQQIRLTEIMVKQKDRKLKLDIQLNKLRKIIGKQLGPVEIAEQINYLIQLINLVLKDYSNKITSLERNQRAEQQSDQSLLIKRQEHQIEQLTDKLQACQYEIKRLQQQLQSNKQSTQETNQLAKRTTRNLTAFQSKTQQLQQSLQILTQNAMQLQEENKILSAKLLKKQQQLLLLDQDINYLRLQTEQHKQQKAELNQLYDKTLTQYRDYKRTKTIEFEKLQSQKQKWQKQCKLRRSQNQAISALDEQKLALMKQLTQMRMLVNLKSTQLEEKKTLMHENQKKVIYLESELYKFRAELQTVKNQKEFAEFENQKLRDQVEDVKKYGNRSYKKDTTGNSCAVISNNKSQQKYTPSSLLTPKHALTQQQPHQSQPPQSLSFSPHPNEEMKLHYNKKLKDKQEKLKALDDIHSLIKKHRNEMQI